MLIIILIVIIINLVIICNYLKHKPAENVNKTVNLSRHVRCQGFKQCRLPARDSAVPVRHKDTWLIKVYTIILYDSCSMRYSIRLILVGGINKSYMYPNSIHGIPKVPRYLVVTVSGPLFVK